MLGEGLSKLVLRACLVARGFVPEHPAPSTSELEKVFPLRPASFRLSIPFAVSIFCQKGLTSPFVALPGVVGGYRRLESLCCPPAFRDPKITFRCIMFVKGLAGPGKTEGPEGILNTVLRLLYKGL